MASEQDVMRLVAELVDRTTGPLAKIRKAWQETHGEAAKGSWEATKAAREHTKAIRELHDRLAKVRETTVELVTPGFAAAGIAIGSVAEAIKSVVESARHYGEVGHQLEMLHRRTKISVGALREYEEMGERVDISSDAMAAGIAKFGDFMQQTARGAPDALAVWQRMPGLWDALGRSLQGLSRQEQLDKVIDFLPRVRDVDQRRTILAMLGLPEDLATITQKEIADARRDAKQWTQDHPFSIENAEKTEKAWRKLEGAMRGIRADMEAAFAPAIADAAEKIDHFLSDPENVKKFQEALKSAAVEIKAEFGDIIGAIKAIKELLDKLDRVKAAITGNSDGTDPIGEIVTKARKSIGEAGNKGIQPNNFGTWTPAQRLAAGMQPVAFSDGFQTSNPQRMLEDAIEHGVFAALRDYAGYSTGSQPGGGGPTQASFGSTDYPNLSNLMSGQIPKSVEGARHHLLTGGRGDEVPAGSGPTPRGATGSRRAVARIVRDEWKRAGMTDQGIAGLMQNIMDESSFNPNLRHPDQPHYGGEAHFAHGLYQEGGAEWNRYRAWLQKNYPGADWRDPRLQSRFAAQNLKTNYPQVWRRMSSGDRYEAAAAYVDGYLKPAEIYRRGRESRYLHGGVAPLSTYVGQHGAFLRDHIRHQHHHEVTGNAKVSVDFQNMPRGVRTKASASGLFKEVKLNRGRQMGMASQDE